MSHWVLTTESIHTFRDDLRQRLGSRRASFIAHKIHFHRALVAKIGEFIGRGKAPKNKVCVFLGTSTRHWRPLCLCRWAWAAGGAFAGRQGTKKYFFAGTFACGGHHRKREIILSASPGRMSPSHSDGLTGELLGQGSPVIKSKLSYSASVSFFLRKPLSS